MAPSYSLLVLALHASGAHAEVAQASFFNGGGICAFTTTDLKAHIGLKGQSECTESSRPEEYISMEVGGLVLLTGSDSDYLTDDDKVEVMTPTPGREVGPRAHVSQSPDNQTAVALTQLGTMVGDPNPSGVFGFVGTANLLMLKGEVNLNTLPFLGAYAENSSSQQEVEVPDVCIVPLQGDHCGPELHAAPGTYKFSLIGVVDGDAYPSYQEGFKYAGFRQRVDVSHMGDNPTVAFNGGDFVPVGEINMGDKSISSTKIKGNTTLAMSFPRTYNVGSMKENRFDGEPLTVPNMTKPIKIHAVRETNTSFFIDYVVEIADGLQSQGGYVVTPFIVVEGSNSGNRSRCVRIPKGMAEQFNARRCS